MENAVTEGWNTLLVDRYVGHAPHTVAERHYFADINRRMVTLFAEQVVAKINSVIGGLKGPQTGGIDGEKMHKSARIVEVAAPTQEREKPQDPVSSGVKSCGLLV